MIDVKVKCKNCGKLVVDYSSNASRETLNIDETVETCWFCMRGDY